MAASSHQFQRRCAGLDAARDIEFAGVAQVPDGYVPGLAEYPTR
jgi:hypothetical protein